MKRMLTILIALGTVCSLGLVAEEAGNEEAETSDVYERMEADDPGTRWEAAGEYLNSIENNPGERTNIYRE